MRLLEENQQNHTVQNNKNDNANNTIFTITSMQGKLYETKQLLPFV